METLSGEITTSTAACRIAGIPSLSLCSAVQRSHRGRDVGRGRGKIMHDDAIRASDPFTLLRLARGDPGRRAPGENDQRKHTCCDTVKIHGRLLAKSKAGTRAPQADADHSRADAS